MGTRDQRQLGAAAAEKKEGERKRKGALGWGERRRRASWGDFLFVQGDDELEQRMFGASL